MISFTVELLHGTIRAGTGVGQSGTSTQESAEWPPSPARLFSALVAGGGTGENNRIGTDDSELRILESAEPPLVAASPITQIERTQLHDRFVLDDRRANSTVQNYPARQATLTRPGIRVASKSRFISYVWPELSVEEHTYRALRKRAARISYFGCADSPVRVELDRRVGRDERTLWSPSPTRSTYTLSVPYPGYLNALDGHFDQFQRGLSPRGKDLRRKTIFYKTDEESKHPQLEAVWFEFKRPVPAGFTLRISEALAKATASLYTKMFGSDAPPVIVGHGLAEGEQRAKFIPLLNVGYERSTGDIHGAAVVLPKGVEPAEAKQIQSCLEALRELKIAGVGSLAVRPWRPNAKQPWAVNPKRWQQTARVWATATPAIHERFGDDKNMGAAIARWCHHAGLPQPVTARWGNVPFVSGGASLRPHQVRRKSFKDHRFSHVEIEFASEISGPIAIGKGRNYGLGLLIPNENEKHKEGNTDG